MGVNIIANKYVTERDRQAQAEKEYAYEAKEIVERVQETMPFEEFTMAWFNNIISINF